MKQLRTLSVALLLIAASAASHSLAQTDEQRAAARALATEGATAFNEGRFKDSADLFARAESLVHAPPHLLFLARSHAKLGQFVRSRETYLKITKEQLPAGAPQAFRDAQSAAQEELRAVEPKIAKLTIQVAGVQDAKELVVKLDGNPVPSVLVGVPQPVDPGEHRIEASAPGRHAQAQSLTLKDGERAALTLELLADQTTPAAVGPASAPVANAKPELAAASPLAAPGDTAPAASGGGASDASAGMRIGSYVAFGVGAVGLGVGTVFLLKSSSKRSDADSAYDAWAVKRDAGDCLVTGGCDSEQAKVKDLDDQADKARTIGVAGLVAGGVGVAAGVTLFVLSSRQEPTKAAIVPVVGPKYLGLAGTF